MPGSGNRKSERAWGTDIWANPLLARSSMTCIFYFKPRAVAYFSQSLRDA
jgi:hypothetical protein